MSIQLEKLVKKWSQKIKFIYKTEEEFPPFVVYLMKKRIVVNKKEPRKIEQYEEPSKNIPFPYS